MLILTADSITAYHEALKTYPRLLVDYYKDNCPSCRMLEMSIGKFANTPAAECIALLKVKLEILGEDFFRGLGLRQTPTLALFKDGSEAKRLSGYQTPIQIAQAVAVSFGALPYKAPHSLCD